MTIKERIAEYLKKHPEGVDDDVLARNLDLSARQQANSRCRQLEEEGLVERRKVRGKIHNFWIGGEGRGVKAKKHTPARKKEVEKADYHNAWYWEGNVQATLVGYLAGQGYSVMSVADTASRQRGKDIEAAKDGKPVWVSVKGYPRGTTKTNPTTQAGHWFKNAVFDILKYRGEDEEAGLGLALPDFSRYRTLAKRIAWLQPVAKFTYYWVQESGEVKAE